MRPAIRAPRAMKAIQSSPEDATIILPIRPTFLFPGIVLPLSVAANDRQTVLDRGGPGGGSRRPQDGPAAAGQPQYRTAGAGAIAARWHQCRDIALCHFGANSLRHLPRTAAIPSWRFSRAIHFWSRVKEIGLSEVITPEIETRMRLLKMRARCDSASTEPAARDRPGDRRPGLAFGARRLPRRHHQNTSRRKAGSARDLRLTQLLDKLLGLLAKRIQVLQLSKQSAEQTEQTLSSQQRDHILREQLRQIQKELCNDDGKSPELKELTEKIDKSGMPKDAEDQARRELKDGAELSRMACRTAEVKIRSRAY